MGKGGANYMMVFVDEYSRYKYLYFLSTKDEAVEKLRHFRSQQVEAYSFKLCELLTDGGGEFTGEFEDFCIDSAIVHKTTSPYTPEENSTTEVYWRTLMEMVRSFLKASGLPASLWPFAAKHANFVLNRMLTVTIGQETKTPYEWRFGLRPNLKHLRVWGCPVILAPMSTAGQLSFSTRKLPRLSRVVMFSSMRSFRDAWRSTAPKAVSQ